MTIALDASSPAVASVFSSVVGTNSAVSAAFTPPLGAVLVAKISTDNSSGSTPTYTCTNTTGPTGISGWVQAGAQHNSSAGGSAFIYVTTVTTSIPMVVTATATGGAGVAPSAIYGRMYVEVWTGAAASQSGAAVTVNTSATQNISPSVTTTRAGSQITGVFCDDNGSGTPSSTDTTTGEGGFLETTGMSSLGCYKSANSGASGSVVTLNGNSGGAGPGWSYVVLEILAPSGASANLTGQSVTSSEGTVGRAVTYGLTGQTITSSEGTITASTAGNVTKSLTGQSITSSHGTLTYNVQYSLNDGVPLTGQTATLTEGTPTGSITYTLTGQSITATEGTISASAGSNVTKTLTGQTITSANGTLISSVQTSSLTAQTATFSEGTLVRVTTYGATGQTATFTEGTITPATSGNVTLTLGSLIATFTEGQMTQSGGTPVISPYLPYVGFLVNVGTFKVH